MKSWKHSPTIDAIAKYVECYWYLEKEVTDQSFRYPKLNPDPAAHLIIANLNTTFEYMQNTHSQHVSGSHWIYPHLNTFTMDHSAPFKIVGIKFNVGALYSLTVDNLSTKLDKIAAVDLNQFIGSSAVNPERLLMNAADQHNQVCDSLDEMLLPWLTDSHENKHSRLVRQIVPLLGNTAISDIGQQLHRSQRTIERSFVRTTGLSMKQVQSMIHLEDILNYLYELKQEDINWTDVASEFGFSDQPHLIRYLKSAIGKTPANYVEDRDLTIDIYGNFEFD